MKKVSTCLLMFLHCVFGYNTDYCNDSKLKYLKHRINISSPFWDLSYCNIIGLGNHPFDEQISRLDLSFNQISVLMAETLEHLKGLVELKLQSNTLKYIETGALHNLPKLKELDLSDNRLNFVDMQDLLSGIEFGAFKARRVNEIQNYELNHTFGLSNAMVVDISENSIASLAPGVFDRLTKMFFLNLSWNALVELPPGVFHNQKDMVLLFLDNNRLTTLGDDVFKHNNKITMLNLSGNKLSRLGCIFANMPMLNNLNISNNALEPLPDQLFAHNAEMSILDMSRINMSSVMPDTFSKMTVLNTLSLAGNNLRVLPPRLFEKCTKLQILVLKGNKIDWLHSNNFRGPENLTMLDLSDNRIGKVEPFTFRHIRPFVLYLSGNLIKDFPPSEVDHMRDLRCLDLANNELESVSDEFATLGGLRHFSIGGNRIVRLPDRLFARSAELMLYVGENPLKCPCINGQLILAERGGVKVNRMHFSDGKSVTCIMSKSCDDSPFGEEYFEWEENMGGRHDIDFYTICMRYLKSDDY